MVIYLYFSFSFIRSVPGMHILNWIEMKGMMWVTGSSVDSTIRVNLLKGTSLRKHFNLLRLSHSSSGKTMTWRTSWFQSHIPILVFYPQFLSLKLLLSRSSYWTCIFILISSIPINEVIIVLSYLFFSVDSSHLCHLVSMCYYGLDFNYIGWNVGEVGPWVFLQTGIYDVCIKCFYAASSQVDYLLHSLAYTYFS